LAKDGEESRQNPEESVSYTTGVKKLVGRIRKVMLS